MKSSTLRQIIREEISSIMKEARDINYKEIAREVDRILKTNNKFESEVSVIDGNLSIGITYRYVKHRYWYDQDGLLHKNHQDRNWGKYISAELPKQLKTEQDLAQLYKVIDDIRTGKPGMLKAFRKER